MILKLDAKNLFVSIIAIALSTTSHVVAEEFEGVLDWSKRVELSTPVNGIVQKVFSQTGKIAAKGEVLVQLDPRAFKADLKYAKAKFKNTNEQSLEAQRELDRQLDMYDRSMLSDHDLQIAKNNFTAAQSNYLQAQAALTKAKLNLEYSAIRAPFNAIVINFGVGGCVNEDALIKELQSGRLRAILDHYVNHKIKEGFIESENVLLIP